MPTEMSSTQLVRVGWLSSKSYSYQVHSYLGNGTFGTVAKCTRLEDKKTVAVKMIKNTDSFAEQAKQEVAALSKLWDLDKYNLVQWNHVFVDQGHICLEFEHLDQSLFDFLKQRDFHPLHLKEIRPIVHQLANALNQLKAVGIIHADLRLANVMLVNHLNEPYRIKVIDFGLACDVSAAKQGSYIQSRPYRCPEIILGLPFTEAIDMWSVGCMAAFLYLGTLLYPGMSEYDMLRYIVETQGQPPDNVLVSGLKSSCFFERDSTTTLWKLKSPEQFHKETGIEPKETRRWKFNSLDNLLQIWTLDSSEDLADKVAEMTDRLMFVDMLKGMLQLDASKRITPQQVLEHQFTSMHHIESIYSYTPHVKSSLEMMGVCQNRTLTSDSGKAVSESLQQLSLRTTHPVQQNLPPPPPPAERHGPGQPRCINPHPCSSGQTTSCVGSGVKRKVVEDETSHPPKRVKAGESDDWHRKSSISSSNQGSTNCTEVSSTALRSHLDQPVHPSMDSHPPKSSQTQSCIRPGVNRKTSPSEDASLKTESDHYERSERKRVRKNYASPSTSSSRQDSTNTAWRNSQGWHQHHSVDTHPSSHTKTESWAWSGLKRKAVEDEDVSHRKRSAVCSEEDRRRSCE